ncbi:hypothetical protein LGT39_08855 [Demequina sp. TTPB684]|uniref:hypothetical protein n=1 Tax=unclassified Demequina TaxID=2620311 RepID=UPI001CF50286|nr:MULTISPECIES: hypothetical protein [unclassified Demequina]MCB2412954.1 hypothetical protein [Demequina sp. TTPB684]UPU88419.1 hypothetical protein LGT36_000390 [Demequina sp. TMPB413]
MAFTMTRPKHEDRLRALDPQTPRTELVQLAAHRDPLVKAAVASRRDCPLASMHALVHESDPRVLEALAANASAPRAVLERLASHRREAIRSLATRRLKYAALM